MPLDPFNLTREASLNRAAIIDLPGVDLPAEVRGQRAYDLLSAAAVSALIKPHKAVLGLADDMPNADLPPALDQCLGADDVVIRDHADAVAAQLGGQLGCLLLMLKRGDPVNRQARAEWDDSYWAHWASIQRVIIGGGLNRSTLGQRIAHHAQAFLHQHGFPDMTVERADHAAVLPLVGAARYAPADADSALIFDFGQTQIKRAVADYQEHMLTNLRMLPPLASDCDVQDLYATGNERQARQRAKFMLRVIETTAQLVKVIPNVVMCGLASYVQHGQPADLGCYGVLRLRSDNVERHLADHLSANLGTNITFRLLHDGTAAAAAYAGADHAAVITMGTALGIGFPPPAERVRPLSPTFTMDNPSS